MIRFNRTALVSALLLALLAAGPGCTGLLSGGGDSEAARFSLVSDNLGALQARTCLSKLGESGCARYPNPLACDRMEVTVEHDGLTRATCLQSGTAPQQIEGSVAEGIPLICHVDQGSACVRCTDIYGVALLDACDASVQPFVDPGDKDGEEPTPAKPGIPSGAACSPDQARLDYAAELNKVLAAENLGVSYLPNLSKSFDTDKAWKYKTKYGDICDYWEKQANKGKNYTQCWSDEPSRCHCELDKDDDETRCRCGRVNVSALRAACKTIPAQCDRQVWTRALTMEYGAATRWLFEGTYRSSGGLQAFSYVGKSSSQAPKIKCLGSPLVLDLGGDGLTLTSAADGVRFDLLGVGPMSTAWVAAGDDALLALDRNGNGRVDDGTELFGEVTDLGRSAADGFAALAAYDRASRGGNGNGLIEAGDLIYDQLWLWNDANHDGFSQPAELLGLAAAGVRAIDVTHTTRAARVDAHGNDLALRGSFLRADGRRGSVVDVLFVAR